MNKNIINLSEREIKKFSSTNFYLWFLNTDTKKKIAITLVIFLLAFVYRLSLSLVNLDKLFYAGLGGQGDYDQFIRAAMCAVKDFCPAILGQNFLLESTILGVFFEIFGFSGALSAYFYLMVILSSIIATLPYILLSRKNWITIGGIIGSLFLATSDFLTQIALNFPPDNGSLFTFSMFFIVYLLTMHVGTIGWLIILGVAGTVDGFNKALFLISDLGVFLLFIPVFIYEKAIKVNKSPFLKLRPRVIFYALIPLLIFLVIYTAWEYFVYIKFYAHYFLGRLIVNKGDFYVSYTSLNDSSSEGNIFLGLFYLCASATVMLKRVIENGQFHPFFLAATFISLAFITLKEIKNVSRKVVLISIFPILIIILLFLMKSDYHNVHAVMGDYMYTWTNSTYVNVFLFILILYIFVFNFKYQALKLSLPIIPYIIMLVMLTKNSPFPRLWVHVVVWSIILFGFLIDWILNSNKHSIQRMKVIFLSVLVILIGAYILPKTVVVISQLYSGVIASQNQIRYLEWVNSELPSNAIVLAGGKSDLITVLENVKKPVIYSTLWNAALLIRPNEIPGVKPSDFGLTGVLFLYEGPIRIQRIGKSDFNIIAELKNVNNFKEKKYIILEDDIEIWRSRLAGVGDGLFTANPESSEGLFGANYYIKVYKFNAVIKKAIYELNIREASIN